MLLFASIEKVQEKRIVLVHRLSYEDTILDFLS